jgi:alkylhydroperoxidase family enzyme
MSTARIPPLDAPFESSVAQAFSRFLPPGMEPLKLFRTQAHNPRVLQRMFAGNLLDAGAISVRERELVILRTCARCSSEYEWGVHVALFAKSAKLEDADIGATLERDLPRVQLSEKELSLFQAVDDLHDTSTISDRAWDELAKHYTSAQIVEIVALVGNYHAVSFLTNALKVEREAFAPSMLQASPARS